MRSSAGRRCRRELGARRVDAGQTLSPALTLACARVLARRTVRSLLPQTPVGHGLVVQPELLLVGRVPRAAEYLWRSRLHVIDHSWLLD